MPPASGGVPSGTAPASLSEEFCHVIVGNEFVGQLLELGDPFPLALGAAALDLHLCPQARLAPQPCSCCHRLGLWGPQCKGVLGGEGVGLPHYFKVNPIYCTTLSINMSRHRFIFKQNHSTIITQIKRSSLFNNTQQHKFSRRPTLDPEV